MTRRLEHILAHSPVLASLADLSMLVNYEAGHFNIWHRCQDTYICVERMPFEAVQFSASWMVVSAYEFLKQISENKNPASQETA